MGSSVSINSRVIGHSHSQVGIQTKTKGGGGTERPSLSLIGGLGASRRNVEKKALTAYWRNLEVKLTSFNGNFHSIFGLPCSYTRATVGIHT